jgi:hypothetical protein
MMRTGGLDNNDEYTIKEGSTVSNAKITKVFR